MCLCVLLPAARVGPKQIQFQADIQDYTLSHMTKLLTQELCSTVPPEPHLLHTVSHPCDGYCSILLCGIIKCDT